MLFFRFLAGSGVAVFCVVWVIALASSPDPKPLLPERPFVPKEPVRGELRKLRLVLSGRPNPCSECHRTPTTPERYPRLIPEHASSIAMLHGRNNYCLNCHNKENRTVFVTHDGSEIPAGKPEELCGKCHGPRHRDWEAGVHGRVTGYWNSAMGKTERLDCSQCHAPHAPTFPKLNPLPGPSVRCRPHGAADHDEPSRAEESH